MFEFIGGGSLLLLFPRTPAAETYAVAAFGKDFGIEVRHTDWPEVADELSLNGFALRHLQLTDA